MFFQEQAHGSSTLEAGAFITHLGDLVSIGAKDGAIAVASGVLSFANFVELFFQRLQLGGATHVQHEEWGLIERVCGAKCLDPCSLVHSQLGDGNTVGLGLWVKEPGAESLGDALAFSVRSDRKALKRVNHMGEVTSLFGIC